MQYVLRMLQLPHGIILVTALASFGAWLLPDFGYLDKGITYPQPLLSSGGIVAALWYASLCGCTWLCFFLGRSISPWRKPHWSTLDAESRLPYVFLTVVGGLGVAALWTKILLGIGVAGVWYSVTSGFGNALAISLYNDYSIGILSLRYVVILASAVALYNIGRGVHSAIDYGNVCLLLLEAVVSHRLALVAACLIAAGLLNARGHFARISLLKVWLAIVLLFIMISALTYARNARYYDLLGIHNMFGMGVSEIISYVGTPFQGAIAVGSQPALVGRDLPETASYAGIRPNYTTNSALLAVSNEYGVLGIIGCVMIVSCFALLMGVLYHIRLTYQGLAYWVCLYGFAELWRLFLFSLGIFIALLVIAFASGAIATATSAGRPRPARVVPSQGPGRAR